MLNNYFIIKETSKFLNKNIAGYLFKEIYSQEKNKILFELAKDNAAIVLEFSIEKGYNYLLLKKNFSKAKKNYADLFGEVYDNPITEVKLYNEDRVIIFRLLNEIEIIFTFFTNKANCYIQNNGKIINSFKDKNENLNKSFDEILPLRGMTETEGLMNVTLKKYLKLNYRNLPDIYINEILFRSGLTSEQLINEVNLKKIIDEIDKLNGQLYRPVNYLYTSGNDLHLSLIPLEHTQASELKKFDDINQLLTEYIKLKFYSEKTKKLKISRSHETEQKISNVKRKLDGINTQLKHCEDSDVLRKSGDIILQNLDSISKGDKKFSYNVTGIDEITIKLKENLSPVENAQNYFDKYKKQKASVNILKSKIINLQKEQKKLEAELNEIKEMNDIKKLIKDEKRSEENKNDETSRFRKFRINDKYEVWVGRDSISNDVLTTRYAAQNDLWFHVRGASGSHTVLKINNSKEHIPKEAILGAASIAAYYSKARNSSNVPVAYCEKKFVKKKKGFKSGTVTMEREKVVFVKPLLPAES